MNDNLNLFSHVLLFSEVSTFGGTEILVNMLTDPREEAVANAACVLTNMATEETLRGEAHSKGVINTLIEGLKSKYVSQAAGPCVWGYVYLGRSSLLNTVKL